MIKKQIISYDEVSKEADIILENDNQKLLVYASRYDKNIEGKFELIVFLPRNIMISNEKSSITKTNESYYSQRIVGILTERKNRFGIVDVCGFHLFVEDIPNDINLNCNVEFTCLRIDFVQEIKKSCDYEKYNC